MQLRISIHKDFISPNIEYKTPGISISLDLLELLFEVYPLVFKVQQIGHELDVFRHCGNIFRLAITITLSLVLTATIDVLHKLVQYLLVLEAEVVELEQAGRSIRDVTEDELL